MIKRAYPEDSLTRSGVFQWHNAFLEDRKELADKVALTSSGDDNVRRKEEEFLNTDHRMCVCLVL